jgi:hypothetical protein
VNDTMSVSEKSLDPLEHLACHSNRFESSRAHTTKPPETGAFVLSGQTMLMAGWQPRGQRSLDLGDAGLRRSGREEHHERGDDCDGHEERRDERRDEERHA